MRIGKLAKMETEIDGGIEDGMRDNASTRKESDVLMFDDLIRQDVRQIGLLAPIDFELIRFHQFYIKDCRNSNSVQFE